MKKLSTFVVALTMAIPMMAIGRNDGSTKANAIDFDWDAGNVHPGGTLWYRVDLAPLYEEENPSLSLYMTNPSRDASVDVSMTATVAGEKEAKDYTIAAHQYKSYTANASMLVRMKQTEIYLTLVSDGEIRLSAKVFEASDLDETCKDAKTLKWNVESTQTKGYAAWWKVDLATVKNAVKKDARITITNIGTGEVELRAGQSLDCPSSGLTKRTFTLAAGESMYDTIPQSMINSVQPDEIYFSIENIAQPVRMKVELIDQPVIPVIPATMALTPLHVTDTIEPLAAGTYLFWTTKAEMNALAKYEPEFTYRNNGAVTAHVSVKMAFNLPAFGTSNTDYELAAGEEEIVVYKKNMLEGLGEDVDTLYWLTTIDQPVHFYGRYKHVREGKACKTNIDFNWEIGHRQEARTTQWYAIDLAEARDNVQDIVVYVQNEGSASAKVKASMAFSCPYIDLQETSRTIEAKSAPVSRRLAYSSYAMMSDTVWIGLETSQDIRFWATTQNAETKAEPDTMCMHAVTFNWEEGVRQNAGDTVWYLINMEEVRDLSAKFPTVFVQNMSSSEAAKITAELSLECPDEIENQKRSIKIAANGSYSKKLSRNLFENIVQDEIYLRVVSTQDVALQIRLTEEAEGSSCSSAIPFNWVSGNTQAANANLWYSVDLRDVMKSTDDVRVTIENRDNAAGKGVAQLIYSCPMDAAPSVQDFSLKSRAKRSITLQNSTFETLDDSIVYINLQGTTSLHIEATRIPQTKPFDTIYAEGLTLIPLQWDSLYTQSVDTAWYIIPQSEIEKVRNLDEKVKPVAHLYNLDTKSVTIKAEGAFAFPIVKKMMTRSKALKAGQHYKDTVPAGTFDQIIKKDSIILRVTRPAGAGDFQFMAELVSAFGGNSRNDALPIRLGETYEQESMTSMWYRISAADLKKDKDLFNKRLLAQAKNLGDGTAKVSVSIYEGLLSDEDLLEQYGLEDYRERKIKKGQSRKRSFPAQAIYALGDVDLYINVTTDQKFGFSTKFRADYGSITPDPKQQEGKLLVPNVDYVIPGDNQEHWYMVCIPYIRNNYKYEHAATLTYEVNGKTTVYTTATLQDTMDCKMPVRKRVINKKGGHYTRTKPLSDLLAKAIKKATKHEFDLTTFQEDFIDEQLRHFLTSDSLTGYVRIKTNQDLKVRINLPQTTGDACNNPMAFDWEHGNVNPAGADTWYHVQLDSLIIPDTCDLRLHVDNWSMDSTRIMSDLYFDCNDPATISKSYKQGADGKDTIDIDRDFLSKLGWADMIINYTSDKPSHIWAELIPNTPREYDYDTIRAYVCQGGAFTDTITGNVIDPVDYSMQWNDTVSWQDGVTMRDSVTTFYIYPLVTPEVLSVADMKLLNAAPLLVQGMQLFVDSSNVKLTEYYRNLGAAVDTIIAVDTVYWAEPVYKANGDLDIKKEKPLDLTSFYTKNQVTDTLLFVLKGGCETVFRTDVVFPLEAYKYGSKNDTICPPAPAVNPDTVAFTTLAVDTLGRMRQIDTIVTYYTRTLPLLYTQTEVLLLPTVTNNAPIDTTITLTSLKQQFEDDADDLTMVVVDAKWEVLVGGTWQDMPYTVPNTAASIDLRYVITTECGDVMNSDNFTFPLNPCPVTYGDTVAVECDSFTWYGEVLTTSGTYTHTLIGGNSCGNDSIVTLTLVLNQSVATTAPAVEACELYYWAEADTTILASGNYTHVFATVQGCDSVVTLPVTIYNAAATTATAVEACELYYWTEADTTILTSGNYVHVFTTVHGCDSVVTLPVTIYNAIATTAIAVEACESYYWTEADTTILTSGNYVHVFTSVHGCDSVGTLPVTINYGVATTAAAVENCESYYWAEADTTILTSGNYVHVFTTVHGCDSVVTLPVTINYGVATTAAAVENCESYYWAEADTTVTASGNYVHVFTTVLGCDSVVTLPVTIHNHVIATPEVVSECNMYTWHGTLYTNSGTYYDTLATVAGCDSICQLNLTITTPYDTTLSLVHKFGDRLLMINRNEINAIPGWQLDSLDIEHPEYVTWYEIDPAGNEKVVGTGYYYNLASGDPLPAGYTYYAVVNIPASSAATCGAMGETERYTIPASSGVPALVPSLARPGEDIRIINLDPETQTIVRIYTAEGLMQRMYTVSGDESFTIKAADANGFYMVELSNENLQTTLRYIVK